MKNTLFLGFLQWPSSNVVSRGLGPNQFVSEPNWVFKSTIY